MIITGLKETIERLEKLDAAVQKKILRKALRAGAKLTLAAAKANAPFKSGDLKRSLKVRAGRSKKGTIRVIMGSGRKWFQGTRQFYGSFITLPPGFRIGNRRLGNKRRLVPYNKYMENAYGSTKQAAVETIRDSILTQIEQTVQALASSTPSGTK